MKKPLVLVMLFTFLLGCSCSWADQAEATIPHYEIYPATPFEDYREALLDFYSVKARYGEFSNFALFPLEIDGTTWPSSEHFYQAHKYTDPVLRERVRQAPTPYDAAKLGRDPAIPKREDWAEVKDQVMEMAVRAKFSQYAVLKKLLEQTRDAELFEHTKLDCYWGDCGDRSGKNKLGLLLMKLRKEYRIHGQSL